MHKWGQKQLKEAQELNITAFMNLMVILVPFLLITAVFSRMTILELNLPGIDSKPNDAKQVKLSLELVLRHDSFDIQDANLGLIKRFERTPGDTQWKSFNSMLLEIKRRFPQEHQITLLVSPDVDYKTLIKVMDAVRSADVVEGLSTQTVELFPDISIGDAPAIAAAPEQTAQDNQAAEKTQ
ncbi:MAG: biopolymer transporter ExbD [Gammaproteobacteria bacterium]|nr:biopolymer transporter ExbD [Gammaproteobacteria bacterium]